MDEVNSQPKQVKEVLQRVAHCNGRVRLNYTGRQCKGQGVQGAEKCKPGDRQYKGQGVQGAGSASQVTHSSRGRECKPGDRHTGGGAQTFNRGGPTKEMNGRSLWRSFDRARAAQRTAYGGALTGAASQRGCPRRQSVAVCSVRK